ncbi:allophanate hydrolase [Vibrio cincinnatiensis]|uniref:allophanate hydrolase n=1 Tax=Vibrio cincinnatiensis TaxID=675 RepID=UPI001EDF072A|nr:allophanate hydrolase [Vibrio cincinnatiensis]MCG3760377.1 allophanate hydrolase [Vibrio cincinnatiensis]MCG3763678.1 allophanate hydrolase [Vibrio cincinnatiensis]
MNTPVTIEQLLAGYRSGEINVRTFLKQKYQLAKEDTHNTWISLISESQLDDYLSDLETKDRQSLPLYGVPFAVKDNIDLQGLPTTAGCKEFAYQPSESAFVVEQLIKAGAVPLGKSNLDQFATGLVGVRSPWGAGKNSFDSKFISGGSSAGSATSVALNQVFFSLGTDTAGSGRVPAAFNNILGLKPTKGLLSCSGVVPACRTLDCVTFFARSAEDIETLIDVAAVYDEIDGYARENVQHTLPDEFRGLRVGVPVEDQLAFFGNDEYQKQFALALERMKSMGAELVEFNLQPFIDAAKLLYQGPWVAERYAAIQSFFDEDSSRCLPVIETIIGGAKNYTAADTFQFMYQLQGYKVQCDKLLGEVDVVITPTAGSTYTIEEVESNPIELNSNLGYYTNFMNLLDYTAIAIPSSFCESGLPFGFTLFAPAFTDLGLIKLAKEWQKATSLPLGATKLFLPEDERVDLLVCGAHMQGLPLNHQLTGVGAILKAKGETAKSYRMYALAGGPPARPGLVRDEDNGQAIEIEVWSFPKSALGTLLCQIPYPLGLGKVELSDGNWVTGFICEAIGIEGAEDITELGGWRNYLATK